METAGTRRTLYCRPGTCAGRTRDGDGESRQGRGRNVILIHANAESCTDFFAPGEVGRIYLNFSDPWPSNRHMKKRLTSEGFLRIYRQILAPGGEIFLKTDNLPFFEYSLMRFQKDGWDLSAVTRDLHSTGGGGVMTEYEEKFSSRGIPICYLEARLRTV